MEAVVLVVALIVGLALASFVTRSAARAERAEKAKTRTRQRQPDIALELSPADVERILPRVRRKGDLQSLRGRAHEIAPDLPSPALLHDELAGDLVVVYAIDTPEMFRMLASADLAALGLSRTEIAARAADNLDRSFATRPVVIYAHGPVREIQVGGHVEAAVLVATAFWEEQASSAKGTIVASVPSRNTLLFVDDAEVLAFDLLRGVTRDAYEAAGAERISLELVEWRDGAWRLRASHDEVRRWTDELPADEDEDA